MISREFSKGDRVRIDPRTRKGGSRHWGRGVVTGVKNDNIVLVKPLGGHKKSEEMEVGHLHHWLSKDEAARHTDGPFWIIDIGTLTVYSGKVGEGLTPLLNHAKDFPTHKGANLASITMVKSNGRLAKEVSDEGLEVMPRSLAKLYIEEQELLRRQEKFEEQEMRDRENKIAPLDLTLDQLSERQVFLTKAIQQSIALIVEAKADITKNFDELKTVQIQYQIRMSREIKDLDKPVIEGKV